jgi:hypothetical protein
MAVVRVGSDENGICELVHAIVEAPGDRTRFKRDVLAQTGVRDVILLEGINDIGFSQTPS